MVTACLVLGAGVVLDAGEKPGEAYQAAMKDLGAASAALRKHVQEIEAAGAYPDYNPIEKDVAALKGPLKTALSFWTAKHADDAVTQAQTALTSIDELETARKEKNYDALMTASANIGKTCGACHTAHREKLPDGSYEIK
jgi:cytochrome c556